MFALTPRAGARNHVFLVPQDDLALKRRIDQLAPEVNKVVASAADGFAARPGFLVAWRTVQQRTTGRSGAEWVCVASSSPCSFQPTEQAKNWLSEKLGELDSIVTRRQWGEVGELFEELPELLRWQQEADRVIRFRPAVDLADSGQVARNRRPSSQLGLIKLLLPTCVVVFLLLVMLLVMLRAADWFKCPLRSSLPPDIAWHALADAVGVTNNQPENKLKQEILTKLQLLFECDEPNTPSPESPERSIEKLLQAFEKAMGRRGTEDLRTLSRSPQLLTELKSLFHKGNFVPTGLVEGLSEETAQFWRSLPARKFHELHNSLVQATQANWERDTAWDIEKLQDQTKRNVEGADQWPSFEKIFNALKHWSDSRSGGRESGGQPDAPSDAQATHYIRRNFYLDSEKDSLKTVRNLLQDICQACNELKQNCPASHQQKQPSTQPKDTSCANAKDCMKMAMETLNPHLSGEMDKSVMNKLKLGGLPQARKELQKLLAKWKEIVE